MSHWIKWSAICLALALLAGAVEKVPLDKVPEPILAAVKARFGEPELVSVEKYGEENAVYFDVELKDKGHKFDLDMMEDGTILEIEKQVAVKDLPDVCAKAVEAKYPTATISDVMEVSKVEDKVETLDRYEVSLELPDKTSHDIDVSLDGKTITEEKP